MGVAADGSVVSLQVERNPAYLGGTARQVLTALLCATPAGHDMMLSDGDSPTEPWVPGLYSVAIMAIFQAAGTAVFRRKELQ